jgi:copper oxidase (laccase) domain-containing protein
MIRWEHGPYVVAFTSRLGGVSGGAFESLNLGALTDDDPLNVVENRRLVCKAVDADASTATMAWQHHSAEVRRAEPRGIVTPGTQFDRCDGLWSDEPGQAMMLLAADCLPIALGRAKGSHPA